MREILRILTLIILDIATHYKFLREIPMFSRYEMRISLGTWDHKWVSTFSHYWD